ncbi:MAG: hypothetical protein IPP40_18200 [bacterium]|nr:hypothetical protein [bacterium]
MRRLPRTWGWDYYVNSNAARAVAESLDAVNHYNLACGFLSPDKNTWHIQHLVSKANRDEMMRHNTPTMTI